MLPYNVYGCQCRLLAQLFISILLGLCGCLPEVPQRPSPILAPYKQLKQHTYFAEGADTDPELSPDGELLYFSTTAYSHTYDIYEKRVDGLTCRLLIHDRGGGRSNERFPAICPSDPKLIAFCSDINGEWDIFYVKDFEKAPDKWIKVSQPNMDDIHPSWSYDGTKLVYCSLVDPQDSEWVLKIYDLVEKMIYTLPFDGMLPQWSPRKADNRILFQRMRHRGNWFSSIWMITFERGEGYSPTEIVGNSEWAAINPAWSPDAKMITFATVGKSRSKREKLQEGDDIWIVRSNGTGLVQITEGPPADWMPVWSKDGRIYFVSTRKDRQNIWSLKPALLDIE
jgi:Tol biopolymer transport system component